MSMNDILQNRLYNDFFEDYIAGQQKTHHFLSEFTINGIRQLAASLDPQTKWHQQVKAILSRQNKDLQSPLAKKYLEQLSNPGSVILITGQQLGLFASPLYTIYKLLTVIKLAERLNSEGSGRSFIPVFWLETEDHDFREINHCGVFDRNFKETQILYQGEDRDKLSIRYYQFEDAINNFLSQVRHSLIETEFSGPLFENLQQWYKPGNNWTEAARSFLKSIFEGYGLLFFEPGDAEIKTVSVDFFNRLLEENEKITGQFEETCGQLKKAGYPLQVNYLAGQTFIHIEDGEHNRQHLYREGEKYYFKDDETRYTRSDIAQRLKANAKAISTTVVSRPLLQSWLLPAAAYIAGPGEIAYWAQLSDLFPLFDLTMPVVYPRITATLIEPRISRHLSKYNIAIDTVSLKRQIFIDRYFKAKSGSGDGDPIGFLKKQLNEADLRLAAYLEQLDPTLVDAAKKTVERMHHGLTNLENRVLRAIEEKNSLLSSHLEQVHAAFYPDEKPQERFLSYVYFLNKFGPQMTDFLMENLKEAQAGHQLVYLP